MKLASWTTIGTPFYRYSGNLKLTDNKIFILSMLLSILIATLVGRGFHFIGWNRYFLIPIYIFVYASVNSLFNAKSIQYRLDRVNCYFVKKWFGVYSKYDEVIVGLASNVSFNLPKNKRPFPSFDPDFNLVTYIGKCINTLIYNYIIRLIIIPIMSSKLRNMGLGLDRIMYKVKEVSHTPINNAGVQPIPEPLENQIITEVIKDNKDKIEIVRRLMTIKNRNLIDQIQELPETKQPKLVHSIYFKNEEIIKAIARHLASMTNKHVKERTLDNKP